MITLEVQPASEVHPVNPKLSSDIEAFLSTMEKASGQLRDMAFSQCLAGFLDEVNIFLDDQRIGRTLDDRTLDDLEDWDTLEKITAEGEDFMEEKLPQGVQDSLKEIRQHFKNFKKLKE